MVTAWGAPAKELALVNSFDERLQYLSRVYQPDNKGFIADPASKIDSLRDIPTYRNFGSGLSKIIMANKDKRLR